jgi:hypothetical protein
MQPRFCFAALTVGLLALGIGASAQDKPRAESIPQPVLDAHHLMELFNEPIYHTLRDELAKEPSGEKGWKTVESEAKRAAEVANLIAIRKEAAEHKDWKKHAGQVQQSAQELAAAAAKKDFDAARKSYVAMIGHCNTCHQSTEPKHAPKLEPFGKAK